MENNTQLNFQEEKPIQSKKEKIIVIVLAIIFIGVLSGMIWDLYGNKLSGKKSSVSQSTSLNSNSQATITPANKQNNEKQNKPTTTANSALKTDSNIAYSSYSTCLENTKDGPTAKDCCDCLNADVSVRKACRDATVNYDFSKNTEIKTFSIPSKLGKTGDYSSFTTSGSQVQCKQACESASSGLVCGDYQYCRTACNSLPQ